MEDRETYAGDLTTDELGKVIRVRINDRTVVEDELVEVRHWRERTGMAPSEYSELPKTWLRFRTIQLADVDHMLVGSRGFYVDHLKHVTVVTADV